jgi:plasmid maintenance system antidote protein VapI
MTKTITLPARRTPPRSLREYLAGPPTIGQRALAEAVGCNQSMISMLVRGTRVPSARLAVKLHAVTGVALQVLLATRLGRKRPGPSARGDPTRAHVSS